MILTLARMALLGRRTRHGRSGVTALCALLISVWATAFPAHAQDIEVFAISGVAVDATEETVAEARELAIVQGRPIAFRRMLERLTLNGDHGRLPEFEPAAADEFIRGFRVDSEKTSAVRYLGQLTYVFDPEAVRTLLRNAGIRFAETVSRPVLVLPLFLDADTPRLWEDPNPWREVWSEHPGNTGLVPLVIPLGDLADIADLDAQAALDGDAERLAKIAARYGARETMVPEVRIKNDQLQAVVRSYGLTGNGVTVASHLSLMDAPVEEVMRRAVAAVVDQINEAWKQRNLLGFGQEERLVATVPFSSLGEWLEVSRRLGNVPPVRARRVLSMARGKRTVELQFIGDVRQLSLAMEQVDLVLEQAAGESGGSEPGSDDSDNEDQGSGGIPNGEQSEPAADSGGIVGWRIRLRTAANAAVPTVDGADDAGAASPPEDGPAGPADIQAGPELSPTNNGLSQGAVSQ